MMQFYSFSLINRAGAQDPSDTTIEGLVNALVTGLLNPLITLLFVLATAVFLWGVTTYVIGQSGSGDEKKLATAKRVMMWGIIGMFIMASAWGIVKVLCDFFASCVGVDFP